MLLHSIFHSECMPIQDISELSPFFVNSFKLDEWKQMYNTPTECTDSNIGILDSVSDTNVKEKNSNMTILQKIETQTMYVSSVQDHLFWTMFLAKYGWNEYIRHNYNYGKVEMEEKKKMADVIHSKTPAQIAEFSNVRIFRSVWNEIISDLMNQPKMGYSGLIGMSFYYQCNIFVIDTVKKLYIPFYYKENDSTIETFLIYKNPNYIVKSHKSNMYFVDIDQKVNTLEYIKANYFGLQYYTKPLKTISNYKKTELDKIAEKLFPSEKIDELKKTELYEKLLIFCSENI